MAQKIFKIAGILMMDIDEKVPSLICKKCSEDVEAVEKLKMRILDADEYYSMMTLQTEKKFLQVDMKTMIEENKMARKSSVKNKKVQQVPELKIPEENSTYFITESRKRRLEVEYDDIRTPVQSSTPYIPKAIPNNLGIHRMIINKSNKTIMKTAAGLAPLFTPKSSRSSGSGKKKKKFTPKLNLKEPKQDKRVSRMSMEPKKISYECDSCNENFGSCPELNVHLESHEVA